MEKKSEKQRFGTPHQRVEKKVKKRKLNFLNKNKDHKKDPKKDSKIKEHGSNLKVLLTKSAIPVIVLIVLILVPNIIGFATYQKVSDEEVQTVNYAAEVETLEEELGILNTNMTTVSGINGELIDLVQSSTEEYTTCVQDKSSLQVSYDNVYSDYQSCLNEQASLSSVSDEVESLEEDMEELQESFDSLAESSANNICGKKKVDDSSIRYYNVAGNEVVCSSSSGESLSC
mgnify:CR=1 FL=1